MIRTIKFSINRITQSKQRRLNALRRELVSCRQSFIKTLWKERGKLNRATMDRIPNGNLSYRHKSNCLKISLETVVATKRSAKAIGNRCQKPMLSGCLRLGCSVCRIEHGKGSFDFVAKISGLKKGRPIVIPLRSHKQANFWLKQAGASIKQGCVLGDGWLSIAVEIPDQPARAIGDEIGVDVGVNKLLATSDGNVYRTEIKRIMQTVRRKKPGGNAMIRACSERKQYINRAVKQLPWNTISLIAIEDLSGIKVGKQPNRGKSFRKAMSPWTARQVGARIEQLAQQNRVRVVSVNPRDTSRRCPMCGMVDKANRNGEQFRCLRCNYTADADFVGSLNILSRANGNWREPVVPVSQAS